MSYNEKYNKLDCEDIAVCSICTNSATCSFPRSIKVRDVKEMLEANQQKVSLVVLAASSKTFEEYQGKVRAQEESTIFTCPMQKQKKQTNLVLLAAQSKSFGEFQAKCREGE